MTYIIIIMFLASMWGIQPADHSYSIFYKRLKRLSYRRETGATLCVSWNVVLRIMNNANRSRVNLSSTYSNYHFSLSNLIVLCTHIVALGSTIAQGACDDPCCTLKWAERVINKLRRRPMLLVTPSGDRTRYFRQRTVVDAEHRGGWTQFSAVRRLSGRLLDRSKNTIFTYPTCIWRPRLG